MLKGVQLIPQGQLAVSTHQRLYFVACKGQRHYGRKKALGSLNNYIMLQTKVVDQQTSLLLVTIWQRSQCLKHPLCKGCHINNHRTFNTFYRSGPVIKKQVQLFTVAYW